MRTDEGLAATDAPGNAVDAEGARIEHLLDEVRAKAGPTLAPRIDELVQRLLALYGNGLGRLLQLVRESGELSPALRQAVGTDALLSSLLLLHDLHPFDLRERVEHALKRIAPRTGPIVIASMDGGRVRLRRVVRDRAQEEGAEHLARSAIVELAPEIVSVEFDSALVPLSIARAAP